MESGPVVDIAMATYNGGKYLNIMLESIAMQSFRNYRLIVSDDCSKDNTIEIVNSFIGKIPYVLLSSNQNNVGIVRNFELALRATSAPYIALCDQDDYWNAQKMKTLLAEIQSLEVRFGRETPLLVFSDIELVGRDLRSVRSSLFENSIRNPHANQFEDFVISNHIPGCSMLFNRALIDVALPFPDVAVHDWWIMLVATVFGMVKFVDRPLIKYRQHGENAIGGGGEIKNAWVARALKMSRPVRFLRNRVFKWHSQADAIRLNLRGLYDRFGDQLPPNAMAVIKHGLRDPDFVRLNRVLRSASAGEWLPDYYGILYQVGRHDRLGVDPTTSG